MCIYNLKECPFNTKKGCIYPINHFTTGCIVADAKEQGVTVKEIIDSVNNGNGLIVVDFLDRR